MEDSREPARFDSDRHPRLLQDVLVGGSAEKTCKQENGGGGEEEKGERGVGIFERVEAKAESVSERPYLMGLRCDCCGKEKRACLRRALEGIERWQMEVAERGRTSSSNLHL